MPPDCAGTLKSEGANLVYALLHSPARGAGGCDGAAILFGLRRVSQNSHYEFDFDLFAFR
ncbi:hypothetical protein HYPGJ_20217 [Hyphomicrobium sp. GJ21]|nr:hypothetical protein HYPGJ_20217 [Hyphomicrobium sp. GJ21]